MQLTAIRFIVLSTLWAGATAAQAQTVKITPLGSHAGEYCATDRAMLFEDPTGVRILYDAGASVAGANDPRLGDVRNALAMRHWSLLDAATRRLAAFQIKRAAQSNPRSLAEMARDSLGLPAVHESLQDDPALRTHFNAIYLALPR